MNLPGAPIVNFHNFFDGENITQEDLVAWVNVGMHHLVSLCSRSRHSSLLNHGLQPQAEDAPNTRTNLAASSFFLTPLNYFDYDVSMDSTNSVLLNAPDKPGDAWKYDDYGVGAVNCIPQPVAPFEYLGIKTFGLDGKQAPPTTAEEMRKSAELFHRIKVEL